MNIDRLVPTCENLAYRSLAVAALKRLLRGKTNATEVACTEGTLRQRPGTQGRVKNPASSRAHAAPSEMPLITSVA